MRKIGRGFSLIELLITIAILGILLALAAPAYRVWIMNMKIRTTAESIQNGLQLARGEAVRRNALLRFQFTDNTGAGCTLSTTASNWIISFGNPAGACNVALLNESFPVSDLTNNPLPQIIQVRTAAEGSGDIVIDADQSTVTFNGLGRVTNAATNPLTINVEPDTAVGNCTTFRCLRVTVSAGGQVRMCDPAYDPTGADPQRCEE